jgi:predicted GNAT family N-acyltransferase
MGIEIKAPHTPSEWKEYYDLRFRILRLPLNQPIGSEKNEGDASGEHFALFENGIIKAIARLDKSEPQIAQVRFVAVEDNTQGKGFGKRIMAATEKTAKEQGNKKMILHARDYAVKFYEKLDYKVIEKSYLLFGVLQHYLMEKKL